ncbi:hypothetical protein FPV67DRAFT_922826 [Lyophyllum atratum]|nr:hypothetical protein FPV67DRAFT_922826 [Lyophyllum atratum]
MTTMEKTNGLLSYRDARRASPRCCVYGFPLGEAGQQFIGEKLYPVPSGLSAGERLIESLVRAETIDDHLISACEAVWPWKRLAPEIGYAKGKYYPIIALAASRRPNDELIPQGEDMAKLKAIMAENGFKEEPRWFVLTT